jgi:hypothetical protein
MAITIPDRSNNMRSLYNPLSGTMALAAILSFSPIAMTARGLDFRAALAEGGDHSNGHAGSGGSPDGSDAGKTGGVAGTIDGSPATGGVTGVPGTANVQAADMVAAVPGTDPVAQDDHGGASPTGSAMRSGGCGLGECLPLQPRLK